MEPEKTELTGGTWTVLGACTWAAEAGTEGELTGLS